MNQEVPDAQAGFRKCRGTRDQTAKPGDLVPWIIGKKQENSRKTYTAAALTMLKPFTEWITTNWKILQKMEIQDHLTCLLRNLYADSRNKEQLTGSKLGKESVKAVCGHPAYLTYMQNASYEMSGWMKHKLESRLPGEISITSDMQMILL